MMSKTLNEKLRIRYRDVNRDGNLKAASWFDFLQEIAADHAAELGFGFQDMAALDVFWALTRMRIRILRQPRIGETINLETWPGKFSRLFAARHFQFTDQNAEVLAQASSQWVVLSRTNFRPRRVEIIGDKMPDTSELPEFFNFTSRMTNVPAGDSGMTFPIRFSMEDVNGHLNNAEYMGLAQDAAEARLGRPISFDELEISFHASARAPESLSLHTAVGEERGSMLISGYLAGGELSFSSRIAGITEMELDR